MSPDCRNSGTDHPLEGRYANYFQVGHNAFEFLLDFGQLYTESERGHIHTRIIINPAYMKSLVEALQESIERQARIWEQVTRDREGGDEDREAWLVDSF